MRPKRKLPVHIAAILARREREAEAELDRLVAAQREREATARLAALAKEETARLAGLAAALEDLRFRESRANPCLRDRDPISGQFRRRREG